MNDVKDTDVQSVVDQCGLSCDCVTEKKPIYDFFKRIFDKFIKLKQNLLRFLLIINYINNLLSLLKKLL